MSGQQLSLSYDLHIHSCLSPCGDNDMTPNNIVGMAKLKGLNVIAVSDHNSARNCRAVMQAAGSSTSLAVIPAMELCTSEECHILFLFEDIGSAEAFDAYVSAHSPFVQNDPAIFGDQLILDENDEITGRVENLLINASDISVSKVCDLAKQFHALCIPAHVDKSAFSILSNLGFFPPECPFEAVELKDPAKQAVLAQKHPVIASVPMVNNSDAHYLWDISEAEHFIKSASMEIPDILNGILAQHNQPSLQST